MKPKGTWNLAIEIHGDENGFALSGGEATSGEATYDKAKVKSIFGIKEFERWRKKYGPMEISLLSCQASRALQQTLIDLIKNPKSKQRAVGLKRGCLVRPALQTFSWNEKDITERKQYDKLSEEGKSFIEEKIKQENKTYGYMGNKKDAKHVLDYYFDIDPKGRWVSISVVVPGKKQDVPWLSRPSDSDFIDKCQGSELKGRTRRLPPVD